MADIQSSCAYCGVGCGLTISHNASQIQVAPNLPFSLKGDSSHPANFGHLCAKGDKLLLSLNQPNTLRYPKLRSGKPLEWDVATQLIADKFQQTIKQYGPDSVALYLSGQLLTEDYYVANKFAKGYLKNANVDTNSRLCMSSAVSAMQRAFGEDVVPGCYQDFEQAEVIVLIGANTAWTHPVLFQRILAAKQTNGCKLVVIDPICTATAKQADLHLAVSPGADLSLFVGLLGYLADNHCLNQEYIQHHTEGFETVVDNAQRVSGCLAALAETVGVSQVDLKAFYHLFSSSKKVLTASCQGVNQSVIGTDTTNAIINCHLALGQIGQAGAGFFSLTGQPNAMGGREVGGLATQLASHMGFSEQEQTLLADFWQCGQVATQPGLAAVEMFDALAKGKIKAIWILGTNPVVSLPESDKVAKALADCPFVVVSEVSPDSDTAKLADVLLPAQGWSEKCGTVTNSERTISRQRGFIAAKGQAKPDWWALSQVAINMGFSGFEYQDNAAIFSEFALLSQTVKQAFPHKRFNLGGLAGLTKAQYDNLPPTQWPVASQQQIGQQHQRVFTDAQFSTASGKAQFITPAKTVEGANRHNVDSLQRKPLTVLLNSGRSRDQWHTMTRTGHIASLRANVPEPTLSLHSSLLKPFELVAAGLVKIQSATDSAFTLARVVVDDDLPLNLANMPMHWSQQFSLANGVNQAIDSRFDPVSKQPGFKCQPVRLLPAELALQGVVFGEHDALAQGLIWQVAQTLTTGICYHLGFAHQQDGFAYQASPFSLQWTVMVDAQTLKNQQLHIQCNTDKGRLIALKILSNQTVNIALETMNALIGQTLDTKLLNQLHQQLKAGNSPLICSCTGVTDARISDEVNRQFNQKMLLHGVKQVHFQQVLDATQSSLGCGRKCGSCHSEVSKCAKKHWEEALTFAPSIDESEAEHEYAKPVKEDVA
ncbi:MULTISPECIES: molybdopterin-dependent oxidoreductase [Pseudomonadati]|uniref:Molybdopterin-dependent oxidoreductase n=1 Tax=Shewanella aestuarii TaxID=1028752 RepID=A0ABT0L5D0_9GAMM|nr:molybdopterin-dependent oxidoreductase [Shewanella aestuarii]MCL1118705.1 molybdopterin-dependent oxidoreductase [Shewanella aestuarii]GGN67820.1 nitrate reductase [Shewanella aestuarii]